MIQWPKNLPLPQRDGYEMKPVSATLRTNMQTGRARYRRLYQSVPSTASVRWRFTNVQAQLFESWFEDTLQSGAEWFEVPLKTPQGIQPYKAHFVDAYKGPTLIGQSRWDFQADLELWEKPVLRGGWAVYAPDYISNMAIFDLAINQKWPAA